MLLFDNNYYLSNYDFYKSFIFFHISFNKNFNYSIDDLIDIKILALNRTCKNIKPIFSDFIDSLSFYSSFKKPLSNYFFFNEYNYYLFYILAINFKYRGNLELYKNLIKKSLILSKYNNDFVFFNYLKQKFSFLD